MEKGSLKNTGDDIDIQRVYAALKYREIGGHHDGMRTGRREIFLVTRSANYSVKPVWVLIQKVQEYWVKLWIIYSYFDY